MRAIMRWVRSVTAELDWPLVVIVAAFIVLVPLYWFWPALLAQLAQRLETTDYERAIRNAAVKTTASGKVGNLRTIDLKASQVEVVTFSEGPPASPLEWPAFVALEAELKAKCAGKPDAARALEQILGLPKDSGPRSIYRVTVLLDKAGKPPIFRPCVSDQKVSSANCSLTFPKLLTAPTISERSTADQKAQAYDDLAKAYDQLETIAFVAEQMWKSYRVGFSKQGFPFTGLGWTYNWDPAADAPVGVSEFIVRKGADVKVGEPVSPESFCSQKS